MDLKSGQLYWPLKNGLLADYPALHENLSCDVAIIGGGITGALVAYHLAEANLECVVLDKRDIGYGSTSATTGLLQYEIDTPLVDLIEQVGVQHAVRAYQLCLEAIAKIEYLTEDVGDGCSFYRKKSVYLASRKSDVPALRSEYEVRRQHGIDVEFLEQSDIEELFSFSRPAAILSHTAGQVDAYRLTHRLLHKAYERGVRVYDRTAVKSYEHGRRGVTLVTDRDTRVEARRVVFATGYESQQYLKQKIVNLKSTYALVSEPLETLAGWYERCLIWETARPYFYLRTAPGNRALIGGEDEDFVDATRRDRLIGKKSRQLSQKFRRLFPAIDMEIAYAWAGTFGETKDGLAYIGETPEFPNGLFALGFGGNGITFSIVAAEMLRDLCLGKSNPDLAIFRFDR